MLQAIRDRATGWIAWAIIILICIPFALWGIQEFTTGDREIAVAQVNDTDISYTRYRTAVQEQRERLRQLLGGTLPAGLDEARLRAEALEGLIGDELLVQASLSNGLRVGDAQLAAAIRSLPVFQDRGRFSQAAYDRFLRSRGTTAQGFELDLRRALLGEQVATALQRAAIVTEQDIDRALRVRNEERRFRTLRVEPAAMEVPEPTEEAIRQWFESHPDLYVQPERVSVRYLELTRNDIANAITADDDELRALYEQDRADYRSPEQREARHILITVARDADEQTVAAARERAEALRARIAGGEDFAEVAKEASQDPGSAPLGGSLGFFGRGVMDPAFEEAAFSAAVGEVSEPVRSRFGWHVIEVTEVRAEEVRPFEDARADVLRAYQQRQADGLFAEQAERLANLAFEQPESLQAPAEALGLEIRTTDPFSRDGDGARGIAARERVRAAAFSEDVLAGNNSELLELGPSAVAVIRLAERQPSRPHTLDEVRDEIAALLHRDARAAEAARIGKAILDALRNGDVPGEAAAVHGLTWQDERTVTRARGGSVSQEVQDTLFSLPAPAGESPVFEGTSLPDGTFVVLALEGVGQAELAPQELEQARERVARSLESGYGQQVMSGVMSRLREQSKVRVLEQNLRAEDG